MTKDLVQKRIDTLVQLGTYLQSDETQWLQCIQAASIQNSWFTIENIHTAIDNISNKFLQKKDLNEWLDTYPQLRVHPDNSHKTIGLVMAGNIPLVGFHDFLCLYLAGFNVHIKLSSKDTVLWKHILAKLEEWNPEHSAVIQTAEMLKNCDIYIATGSNNTSRYFEAYFGKYPHIIRKNRTSAAILNGDETQEQLKALQKDCSSYFGMGCRNVTHLYVPENYDFQPLIQLFDEDEELSMHAKYKNNFDYYLAIYLLNKVKHYQGSNILLVENTEHFAPIASLHYTYYQPTEREELLEQLEKDDNIQSIIGAEGNKSFLKTVVFGEGQQPDLTDYADGVDTMAFLSNQI